MPIIATPEIGIPLPFDTTPEEIEDFREKAHALFETVQELIKQGATVIVPGEGLSNELLVSQGIKEVDGVPVLDPVALTLEFARLMHSLKELGVPSKSQFGYWSKSLDKEARDRLLSIFLSK